MPLAETAYAKINLALHVRRRMANGYHALETIFAFADDGDCLTVAPADTITLTITGPFAASLNDDPDNLVTRAARAAQQAFDVGAGAALALDKRLPVASGIGGGSADAAATLRLLARLWSLDLDDARFFQIAATLGADVPACLRSVTVRGDDRGDALTPIDGTSLTGTPLLLVNPDTPCATGPVFMAWDGRDRGALTDALTGRNDLEAPARALVPAIGDVLDALTEQPGHTLVRMSGSGATCFALFADRAARDAAADAIRAARPDWWTLASTLR